jgi:hypothetical protein
MIKRLATYNRLLTINQAVPQKVFLDEMRISRATFKRDLDILRTIFNIPVLYDAWEKGYYLADKKVFNYIFKQEFLDSITD